MRVYQSVGAVDNIWQSTKITSSFHKSHPSIRKNDSHLQMQETEAQTVVYLMADVLCTGPGSESPPVPSRGRFSSLSQPATWSSSRWTPSWALRFSFSSESQDILSPASRTPACLSPRQLRGSSMRQKSLCGFLLWCYGDEDRLREGHSKHGPEEGKAFSTYRA